MSLTLCLHHSTHLSNMQHWGLYHPLVKCWSHVCDADCVKLKCTVCSEYRKSSTAVKLECYCSASKELLLSCFWGVEKVVSPFQNSTLCRQFWNPTLPPTSKFHFVQVLFFSCRLVGLTKMLRIECSGKTRFALHAPKLTISWHALLLLHYYYYFQVLLLLFTLWLHVLCVLSVLCPTKC